MKTNSTLVLVVRIIAFVLLCLYSLLVFGQAEAAPVANPGQVNKFNGTVIDAKGIRLQWTLSTDNSASTVTVEKSSDATSFSAQAEFWVNMEGNFQTDFKWSDSKLTKGASYYRLKITDNKGNVSYTSVLEMHNKKGDVSFIAQPSTEASAQIAKS